MDKALPSKHNILKALWANWPSRVATVMTVLTLVWLVYIFAHRALYITSSNAIVDTDTTTLTSQVDGIVQAVYVVDQAPVKRGQLLAELDPRPLRSAYQEAQSSVASAQTKSFLAARNMARAQKLFSEKVISPQEIDKATSENATAEELYRQAKAQAEQATLNLSYTQIIAPTDGILAFRNAEPGLRISKGQPLFGFVPVEQRWITAKVRETDMDGLRIGEDVAIKIDAYPDKKFTGKVVSIAQASEVPFSAVRNDFAAGNFTKYVQWVPIRISLALSDAERPRIPIGSTCDISLRRHH